MSAVDMDRTPSLVRESTSVTSASLSRTRGILVETMQLVEPRKSLPVPNHILESKIYARIDSNSVVQARPALIHFAGFELGITQQMTLRLGNVSSDVQRMHVIPPQTKYFSIKYKKKERLVPGFALDCVVEFTADEWRYYFDSIRVHCQGEENLIIPIHAYPVMGMDGFPKHLTFPQTPVGDRSTRVIPLRCDAPVDFEFQLTCIQHHPAFSVEPMAGLVPAQGEVDIVVAYLPTEFSTAQMKLQLTISQFNSRPLICVVTGNSMPGLAKEIVEKLADEEYNSDRLLDPRSITPIDRSRKKRKMRSVTNKPMEVQKSGIWFPSNLNTTSAVSHVLLQDPNKLRLKDIRDVVLQKNGEMEATTRQIKEAMFEIAMRKEVYEERQNQLRWQCKLGDDQITLEEKHAILESREIAFKEYKLDRGDPVPKREVMRTITKCSFRRTTRKTSLIGKGGITFDTLTNDMWASRHSHLTVFKQAARRVIIRKRASKRIKCLRQMITDFRQRSTNSADTAGESANDDEGGNQDTEENLDSSLRLDKVTSITFPTYVEPNVKDDMAVDALGAVSYQPTEVVLPKKTPYFNLRVPQQYSLMGYSSHDVHDASLNYVPPYLATKLRTGAEDEIIVIPPPALREPPPEDKPINEGDMRVEAVTETPIPAEPISLKAPDALFKPIEYPQLHIFNPTPGLQVFQPPLPYAEVDPDFHLCPLPRYTSLFPGIHASTQKKYLDREDIIRNVMSWKKFPSQGLTIVGQRPTITNVWVPRWKDPFVSDVLPEMAPAPMTGLGVEDQNNIAFEDDEEAEVSLTPDMVSAQFQLIDLTAAPEEKPKPKDTMEENAVLSLRVQLYNQKQEELAKSAEVFPEGNKLPATVIPVSHHGQIPREQRELELDNFMKKKNNRIGAKMTKRIDYLNSLKTNLNLVLN